MNPFDSQLILQLHWLANLSSSNISDWCASFILIWLVIL